MKVAILGATRLVGRVRKDPVFDGVTYVALAHNIIRGAAGCVILITESMEAQGYL
jgi:aspartate-semialdehyde dehydrogenase